jgi:hypothetical protein
VDVDVDIDLRVDKGLEDRHVRVPQGIKKRGPALREMADGGDIRSLADDPDESWIVADEGRRMKEGSGVDNEITKEVGEYSDLDLEKPLRIQFDCVGEVRNPQAQ